MNYGTFKDMSYGLNGRDWPPVIQILIDNKQCFTLDNDPYDGTGWIKWDNDQTINGNDANIVSVIGTSSDGRKKWLQSYLDDDQDRLDVEIAGPKGYEHPLFGWIEDAEYIAELTKQQTKIDARQKVINLI